MLELEIFCQKFSNKFFYELVKQVVVSKVLKISCFKIHVKPLAISTEICLYLNVFQRLQQ